MSESTQSNADQSWLAAHWHDLLDAYTKEQASSTKMAEGSEPVLAPAKKKKSALRVQRLEISIGQIAAQISEGKEQAFELEIELPILDDATWRQITDTLGSQALFAAQMLAGNLPIEIQSVFEDSSASLLPTSLNEWSQPSATITVKNLDADEADGISTTLMLEAEKLSQCMVAIFTMLGELVEDDPWLLLELHGRTQPQILQALRESRVNAEGTPPATNGKQGGKQGRKQSDTPTGSLSAEDTQVAETSTSPFYILEGEDNAREGENENPDSETEQGLEDDLERFWGAPKRLKHIHHQIETPDIDLILLRRLGPPPFHQGSIELYEQLETLYRQVSERAIALAYTADADEREA